MSDLPSPGSESRLSFPELQFLKLGGSLITDKARPRTPRMDVLARLAGEIADACQRNPGMRLLLGHGSGSFGHIPARKYGTRQGVHTREDWRGFGEVYQAAASLNRLVMDAFIQAGLPAVAFPPSSCVMAEDGRVAAWELGPLRSALNAGLLPVIYGDVVFDSRRSGTILSTEDLFAHLAGQLGPQRVLLAGREPGVWADYPACTRLLAQITPEDFSGISDGLGGSAATDVTGGMASKVQAGLDLARSTPGLEVLVFSGETPGAVRRALAGESPGTLIRRTG